jgi:hypothetical protein
MAGWTGLPLEEVADYLKAHEGHWMAAQWMVA